MNGYSLGAISRADLRIGNYVRICVVKRANATASRAYSPKNHDPLVNWFTPEDVEQMSRRDLQRWCKKLSLRANSKTVKLREDLLGFHRDVLSSSSILKYPFLHSAKHVSVGCSAMPRKGKSLFPYRNGDLIPWSCGTDGKVLTAHEVRRYNKTTCNPGDIYVDDTIVCTGTMHCTKFADKQVPSVSGILRATAAKSKLFAISRWTKKQKELLGEDVFQERMKEAKRIGSEFHRFIHRCLVDRSLNTKAPESLQGLLNSTKEVFTKLGDAVASEVGISHPYLGYKGRVDTVACYDGDPCIIEWKTSERKKPYLEDCGDYPIQVVAYAGAVNSDNLFGFSIKRGLIVVAYKDGSPADVHGMNLEICRSVWQDWLMRVHKFYNQDIDL